MGSRYGLSVFILSFSFFYFSSAIDNEDTGPIFFFIRVHKRQIVTSNNDNMTTIWAKSLHTTKLNKVFDSLKTTVRIVKINLYPAALS